MYNLMAAVTLVVVVSVILLVSLALAAGDRSLQEDFTEYKARAIHFVRRDGHVGYRHHWPGMKFGWRIVVGTVIGFLGAAFGSVGGVGGGGIFVPMLTLIIGFDPKSSTAMSKCMITGAAATTVYYNLRLRHPNTADQPIIDYELALLFQPMLMLGISVGVAFNVIFANWMVTILLIVLFIVTSSKAFLRGIETWKKETIVKREAAARLASNGGDGGGGGGGGGGQQLEGQAESNESKASEEVSIMENIQWKQLAILIAVWASILALQILKNKTTTCSAAYWALNSLQIPIAVGASAYQAVRLYKGRSEISSKGEGRKAMRVHRLLLYCFCGILAGVVGGLLGLGGGFIMAPLFLELGIHPQVSSATATFIMMFSSSMSVVEYYLLKRFPIPYALYFGGVAMVAAFSGQHVVTRAIAILGRASLIIFILAITIFISAILLGGVGISNMVKRMERKEYMGFDDICSY
ncbi:sulfite exporter TauE/SafE family protein 3-like [Diospyros lotus]|uniref:sulfite exporter TauE/SafE family protein 3-like n=1 Tax=Diospyros lotus TaxID=55363 RepID=UPI0022556CB9|nr:sulfite exporter TauE/SafE family protein 3-like [Diospyros lotus]